MRRDFWDHNVLFDGDRMVAILDLDFMEERPPIDDLALVLYYAYPPAAPPETGGAQAPLAALVRAYSEAAEPPLTSAERSALPLAIAPTRLRFTRHMALRYP